MTKLTVELYLLKLALKYLSEEQRKHKTEQIEIECRPINKSQLDKEKWKYDKFAIQEVNLDTGLLDIAHWCLKYEIKHEYKYDKYSTNCKLVMMALCAAFKIC